MLRGGAAGIVAACLLALALAGCGGGGSGHTTPAAPSQEESSQAFITAVTGVCQTFDAGAHGSAARRLAALKAEAQSLLRMQPPPALGDQFRNFVGAVFAYTTGAAAKPPAPITELAILRSRATEAAQATGIDACAKSRY
jgi:hypothetical protein